MSRNLIPLSIAATLIGGAVLADAPRVAVDIAPVHSLVARVMMGVGTPDLIVAPGASPHEYSLRPSEALALQEAQLVFWVSPDLTPWLGNAIHTLTGSATVTEFLKTDGTIQLPLRQDALFETHAHEEVDDHQDHAKDEGHEDEGHDDHDTHDEEAHDDHGHQDHDAHAWLSPDNAATWLNVIAAQLSAADPQNADAYLANAAAGRAEIDALKAEVSATLDPVREGRFIVFHDAYQYFEVGFDFPASGAISLSDATDPSPARITEIQTRIAKEGVDCVLTEPQFNPGLVATVLGGTQAATGLLDPMGSDLEPGPALYPQLIRNLGKTLAGCL